MFGFNQDYCDILRFQASTKTRNGNNELVLSNSLEGDSSKRLC
jgi:hypothetical protein